MTIVEKYRNENEGKEKDTFFSENFKNRNHYHPILKKNKFHEKENFNIESKQIEKKSKFETLLVENKEKYLPTLKKNKYFKI
jgi:hypothetical protein